MSFFPHIDTSFYGQHRLGTIDAWKHEDKLHVHDAFTWLLSEK